MASDNFTNTNGTALETHNSNWGNEAVDIEIQSNAAQNEADNISSWTDFTGSASDYSKITVKAEVNTKSQWNSPLIRNNGAQFIGYRAVMRTRVVDNWTEVRVYEAGGDSVGTTHTGTWSCLADHTLAIEATDNGAGVNIEIWIDGVQGITINQTTRTYDSGGTSGFVITSTADAADSAIDDWTDTAGGGATTILPFTSRHLA